MTVVKELSAAHGGHVYVRLSVCPSVCLFIYPTVYLSVHDGSQLKEASNWSFLRPFCVLMMTMMMTLYSRV